MQANTSRRGRPKGTGIDDRPHLESIDRMLASDPALRPTTAIKALGFDDPSIIRRLRDKYKTWADQRHVNATDTSHRAPPQRPATAATIDIARPALLRTSEPVRRSTSRAPKPIPARPATKHRSAPDRRSPASRRRAAPKPPTLDAQIHPASPPPRLEPSSADHQPAAVCSNATHAAADTNPLMTMMMLSAGAIALAGYQQLALCQALGRHPLTTAAAGQQLWMARFLAATVTLATTPRERT